MYLAQEQVVLLDNIGVHIQILNIQKIC
jgi:hypothetical protein